MAAVAVGHPEGDDELVGGPQARGEEGKGLEEALDVLPVVLPSDAEDERVLEPNHPSPGLGRSFRPRGRAPECGGDAGADGGHPGGIDAEAGDRLVPARRRDRQHPVGGPDELQPGTVAAALPRVGQILRGEDLGDEVVEGDDETHGVAGPAGRPHPGQRFVELEGRQDVVDASGGEVHLARTVDLAGRRELPEVVGLGERRVEEDGADQVGMGVAQGPGELE